MSRPPLDPLVLAELLRVDPLARAKAVHLPDPARAVHEVVLAQTFDRLHRAAPHSLVVLHDDAATGGWALAAALHAGWERNVSAVVVPQAAMSPSSAVLADRLGIALLVISDEPVDVALTLAGQVSAPQAARALRVALCAERLAEQSSLRGVLGVLNSELTPVPVALLVGGAVAGGRAAAAEERPDTTRVRVEIQAAGRPWAELVAAVPAEERGLGGARGVRAAPGPPAVARGVGADPDEQLGAGRAGAGRVRAPAAARHRARGDRATSGRRGRALVDG